MHNPSNPQKPKQAPISSETLHDDNPEKLPQKIKIFRTMSSTELHKFISGEKMTPIIKKDASALQDISTADTSAIWFSPDRAEYYSEPSTEKALVSTDLPELNFDDVREVWNLGRGGINDPTTNNLIVEFLTDKKPSITYGKYGDFWVKEYTYPEYDDNDFQVQRIYKISAKDIIFDRMSFRDYTSAEEGLKEVTERELEEEQWMENRAVSGAELLKKYASKLPPAY